MDRHGIRLDNKLLIMFMHGILFSVMTSLFAIQGVSSFLVDVLPISSLSCVL